MPNRPHCGAGPPGPRALIGDNQFELLADAVTPAPYNHPPYSPAGVTAIAFCVVTGAAPQQRLDVEKSSNKPLEIPRICAWCVWGLGTDSVGYQAGEVVTHGSCESCAEVYIEEHRKPYIYLRSELGTSLKDGSSHS